jgi:hypothetical protein
MEPESSFDELGERHRGFPGFVGAEHQRTRGNVLES